MAILTLIVTVTEDYSDLSPAITPGTNAILFNTSSGATASFDSSQFGGSGISDTVLITGDGFFNRVTIFTPSDAFFSAAGWAFANWSASVNDRISIFGTAAAETITGSSEPNFIQGSDGADILTGGDSDDIFSYVSATEIVAGEVVDGKGGTDRISSATLVDFDFSVATLANIETLAFAAAVTLAGGQIGSGAITEIVGATLAQALIVNGAAVNLSAVTFTAWTAGVDTVTINGTAGNDSLTGSSQIDTLLGGDGADTLNGGGAADLMRGGASNDTYVVDNAGDVVDESVGGDNGIDTVQSFIDFNLGTQVLGTVENLTLLGSAHVGTGNALANIITGNAAANTIIGGGGGDTMFAGLDSARDFFAYAAKGDVGKPVAKRDHIFQFDRGANKHDLTSDKIDLHLLDADKKAGDQKFRFVAAFVAPVAGQSHGEVMVVKSGHNQKVLIDFNGDTSIDAIIFVHDSGTLHKYDFLL